MALNQVGLERLGDPVTKKIGTNKNIIINGAMQVAQRGTSSTSEGYQTVDRLTVDTNGVDEAPTYAQVDVASGTTPYTLGFRKAFKVTNGNQTSGAGATDYIQITTRLESQDIANSGWNYTSTSSFITLSFYVKSSVAQVFSGGLRTFDSPSYQYKFDTPSLSADTWTKVTKTISGNSNLVFNNDNGRGLDINLFPFIGTTYTTANGDTETWVAASSANFANDMTSTWYTTNDATFEITGVQLEVGSVATDFEFKSIGQELALCQRYYTSGDDKVGTTSYPSSDGYARGWYSFKVNMRGTPTMTFSDGGTGGSKIADGISNKGFYATYGSLSASQAGTYSWTATAEL